MNDKLEWEYQMCGIPLEVWNADAETKLLNQMGKEGWQLAAVYRHEVNGTKLICHYLKRPKEKNAIIVP